MTDVETHLRAALAERAADVPADAVRRVIVADYRPRSHALRPRLAAGGGLAGLAAAGAAIVSTLGGAAPAFAGWSAHPTHATRAQLAAADRECRHFSPPSVVPFPTKLPLVVNDTRGPFTFRIYADATNIEWCTTGPSFSNVSGVTMDRPLSLPPQEAQLEDAQVTNGTADRYSLSSSPVGSAVTRVVLRLRDGTNVTATVNNGWAVAWWPGWSELKDAVVTTASGTHVQVFHQKSHACVATHTCGPAPNGPHGG